MALEFQLDAGIFKRAIARFVQNSVDNNCTEEFQNYFVDHIDVGEVRFENESAIGIEIPVLIQLAVFIVSRDQLAAAVDAIPVAATQSVGNIMVRIILSLNGTAISVRVERPDLSSLGLPLPLNIEDKFEELLQDRLPDDNSTILDVAEVIEELQIPQPATSNLAVSPAAFALRFDSDGPLISRLVGGQGWCLFMSADTVIEITRKPLPPDIEIMGITLPAEWHLGWFPVGSTPSIAIRAAFDLPPIPPIPTFTVAAFKGTAMFTLSPVPATLRVAISWDIQITSASPLGAFIADKAEGSVRMTVRKRIKDRMPDAVPINSQSLYRDIPLPVMQTIGIRLQTNAVLANAAGMTIGGPTLVADISTNLTQVTVAKFDRPIVTGICLDKPKDRVLVREVTLPATLYLKDYGAYCTVKFFSNTASNMGPFIEPPIPGSNPGEVYFRIPGTIALGLPRDVNPLQIGLGVIKDVLAIVQTTRGVRQVNLGRPNIDVALDGSVMNVIDLRIRECIKFYEPKGKIGFGGKDKVATGRFRPLPIEEPDWMHEIGAKHGLDVHLVHFSGLSPGEIVEFRSQHHRISVSADAAGTVRVPAFLPLADSLASASIQRINQQSLTVAPIARTATFSRAFLLKAEAVNHIHAVDGVSAMIELLGESGLKRHYVGPFGLDPLPLTTNIETLNPKPPTEPHHHHDTLLANAGLPELPMSSHAIAGFEDEPMLIAVFEDNPALLIERDTAGVVRIAGVFEGPVIEISHRSDWAISKLGRRLQVFSVERSPMHNLRLLEDQQSNKYSDTPSNPFGDVEAGDKNLSTM